MKKIFTSVLACGVFATASAQWSPTSMRGEKLRTEVNAKKLYTLDLAMLNTQLKAAQTMGKGSKGVIVSLPTLNGNIEKFEVYSLPVVVQSLADRYQLGSYTGVSVDDPSKFVRFSTAPNDFQSMIYKDGKYEFIEPQNKEKTVYGVFPKTDKNALENDFVCKTNESTLSKEEITALTKQVNFSNRGGDFQKNSDKKYRTYRLALSVTGEYTQFFGGVPQALAAMNATMTRVNGVFEKDFAVHLILQDFPQLIYTDPSTDPYSPAGSGAQGAWNKEIQTTLTNTIGNAAYDIGHLFGRSGGGGSAGDIGNVCRDAAPSNDSKSKGSAFTSPSDGANPVGDTFDIDYVAHEMGHQFGAWHIYTFRSEYNSGNIEAQIEPGSGSSIMGYAGITPANVQMNSDPYFNGVSIKQVQTYVNSQNCDVNYPISNMPPVVAAMPEKTIPKGTAFVLTANATDAENNPLTYTWEQNDPYNGALLEVTGSNTTGPNFRSIIGTSNPSRYFPKESMVLAGSLSSKTEWEAVSNVPRVMNFRVTVRDNHSDIKQQQTQFGTQKITVGNDGPFKVNTTKVFNNAPTTILWDVANTDAAPYNVGNVKIEVSANNGTSWTTLVASTPNTGSFASNFTTYPLNQTLHIRISAIDNVFYAANQVTVSKIVACDGSQPQGLQTTGITQTGATSSWDAVDGATYNFRYKKEGDANYTVVNGLTNTSYTMPNLTLDTKYEVGVAAVCSGTVGTFATSTFTTLGLVYCSASSNNATLESISNVSFANINNSSTQTTGYEDYTSIVGNITKGTKYTFTANAAKSYTSDQVIVWIDFNKNGSFTDPGEQVFISSTKKAPWTGEITIPETAATGLTRMRVRLHDASISPNATPCGTSSYGQVEDYSLNIGNLAVSDISSTKNGLQLYPNPASDHITISNIKEKSSYQIVNMAGQVVANGTTDGKVQVAKLEKGVYVITVKSNDQTSSSKFIKN